MRRDNPTWPMKPLACIIGGLILFSVALAKEDSPLPNKPRLREGTRLLETAGRFEAVGDRVNFVIAESGQSMDVLSNLALERIVRVLKENQGRTQWTVSGTITEYNEANYLLLTKAVQVGKSTPQESAKASGIGARPKVDYFVPQGKVPAEKKLEPSHDKHP